MTRRANEVLDLPHINVKPVTLARCYSEWPLKVQRAARERLRYEFAKEFDLRNATNADALLESVWNAIVGATGHDAKKD